MNQNNIIVENEEVLVPANFFILRPIRVKEKTDEMLKKEYEMYKFQYGLSKTFETFFNSLKMFHEDKFDYSEMDLAIYLDKDKAVNSALMNVADYNDGGVYNYSAVVEYPVGASYFETLPISIKVFKYQRNTSTYVEVTMSNEEEVKLIFKKHYMSSDDEIM